MYVQDLVDFVRQNMLDDTVEPYLWSDDTLSLLAKEAERQACIRADLLIDSTTYYFDTIKGTDLYPISNNIIRPLKLFYNNNGITIEVFKYGIGKNTVLNTEGIPYQYRFVDNNTIKLYPTPDNVYHINIIASIYPPNTSQFNFDISEQYQSDLKYYIAGQALLTQDLDAKDINKAQFFLSKFDEAFGLPKDYKSLQRERLGANVESPNSYAKVFGFE